jgi:cytochrome b pre-mRNA-processing protein 3
MLRFLFPRLTAAEPRGSALFTALIAEARRKDWFVAGGVGDTVDGRFAVLSTVTALATVRLERGGDQSRAEAVALTERFIEAMDSEHRQMGLGDPTLGKTVRKLVSALGRRAEQWRKALGGQLAWEQAAADSLFRGAAPVEESVKRCSELTRDLWARLESADDQALSEGKIA